MSLRTVFFGMTGRLSVPPLEALLRVGADVQAVVTPAVLPTGPPLRRVDPLPRASLPLLTPAPRQNILHLAWARQIPVWAVSSLTAPPVLDLLASLRPDLIVTACFPFYFPPDLLGLPRLGCLNLHPSPLPAYRGPAPLFWMARRGEAQAGVTLHFMNDRLDAGDIVAQTTFPWPEGAVQAELENLCGQKGAHLLESAYGLLKRGEPLPRYPQDETQASTYPWPAGSDLEASTDWPARRVFQFLRGANEWLPRLRVGERVINFRVVNGYEPEGMLNEGMVKRGDELWIQCSPGILKAKPFLR